MILIIGCFNVGAGNLPMASEGYQPKKNYEKRFNELWNTIQSVLLEEHINVITQDKENKRIQTDYIQGATQVGLIGGSLSTRYKYNIVFPSNSENNTSINIIANLESSSKSIDWHDISQDNAEKVTGLENYLYEKIEQKLR